MLVVITKLTLCQENKNEHKESKRKEGEKGCIWFLKDLSCRLGFVFIFLYYLEVLPCTFVYPKNLLSLNSHCLSFASKHGKLSSWIFIIMFFLLSHHSLYFFSFTICFMKYILILVHGENLTFWLPTSSFSVSLDSAQFNSGLAHSQSQCSCHFTSRGISTFSSCIFLFQSSSFAFVAKTLPKIPNMSFRAYN